MDTPVPMARTCEPCAKAKIRCTKRDNASVTCERCDRLKKECTYRPARRRNNGTRKDKRIEALEAKFNQLLEAQKPSHSRSVSPLPSESHVEDSVSVGSSTHFQYGLLADPADNGPVPERLPSSLNLHEASTDAIGSRLLHSDKASFLLDTFRTTMTVHFPFTFVEASVTIEELRAKKPFLLLTILAAASYNEVYLQRALQDEVKQAICTRIILRGEVSLELLQGLLVHIAWCHYQSKPRMFTHYMSLAIGMIVHLRLDQPRQNQSWKTPMNFTSHGIRGHGIRSTSDQVAVYSSDEQRAVAGCFYLSSSTSLILQKTSTFSYSSYLETCCTHISSKGESPHDKYILYIVQLQRISEKIDQLYSRHGPQLNDPDASVELLISSLQSELNIFKDRLPFDMNESYLLKSQFHTSELHLYQLALNQDVHIREQSRTRSPWQLKIVRLGLQAAKDFFDCHLTIPPRAELVFSNSQWIQLGFSLLVSTRLCVLAASDRFNQDTEALRQSLGMSEILQQLIIRLQSLKNDVQGVSDNEHMLSQYERRGKMVQKWFEEHNRDKLVLPIERNNSNETYQSMGQYLPQNFSGLSSMDQDISLMDPQLLAEGIYDLQAGDYFPDSMEGLMGDWMSY